MKVFTHGSIVNFQESAQEMTMERLKKNLLELVNNSGFRIGSIDILKEEIHVYGDLENLNFDDDILLTYKQSGSKGLSKIKHIDEELQFTHHAIFDVKEEDKDIRYEVFYLTFELGGELVTYFIADSTKVSNYLDYVVDFWFKVNEVGGDIDFSSSGCLSNFKP